MYRFTIEFCWIYWFLWFHRFCSAKYRAWWTNWFSLVSDSMCSWMEWASWKIYTICVFFKQKLDTPTIQPQFPNKGTSQKLQPRMWTCSISGAYFHGESGSEILLRKMAGGSSATPTAYIPYSGQYRHYLTVEVDTWFPFPTPHEMVSPPDSSETFSSCSTFWL